MSIAVSFYMYKGDIQNCANYQGTDFIIHASIKKGNKEKRKEKNSYRPYYKAVHKTMI